MVTLTLQPKDVDALCRAMLAALFEGQLGPVEPVLDALRTAGYDSKDFRDLTAELDMMTRSPRR
jgi:hypothetical protein